MKLGIKLASTHKKYFAIYLVFMRVPCDAVVMRTSTSGMVARMLLAAAQDIHHGRAGDALDLIRCSLHVMALEVPSVLEQEEELARLMLQRHRENLALAVTLAAYRE